LSRSLGNMLKEPGHFRRQSETGFEFLLYSHNLLSYISALGAHRGNLANAPNYPSLNREAEQLAANLEQLASDLEALRPVNADCCEEEEQNSRLAAMQVGDDDHLRLLHNQLLLISQQLAPLRRLASRLAQQ